MVLMGKRPGWQENFWPKTLSDNAITAIVFMSLAGNKNEGFIGPSQTACASANTIVEAGHEAALAGFINHIIQMIICHLVDALEPVFPHGFR